MPMENSDIWILGAGILGSACAWQLSQKGSSSVTVIDVDLAGTYSSSELNAGGARATWWHPLNIELAWKSLQFYRSIAAEIQFFPKGYLFLYGSSKWRTALSKKALYQSFGIPVDFLDPADLAGLIPEFENHKGICGATFSPQDGLLDPHLLREFYRSGAKARGVRFLDRTFAENIGVREGKISELVLLRHAAPLHEEALQKILVGHAIPATEASAWEKDVVRPKILLNCTGAWLKVTSAKYGPALPVEPVRRQISLFSSAEEDFSDRGMIVDSSGLYFHAEGSHSGLISGGYSNRDEKPGYNFRYDGEKFFDRKIWLRLYRRGARRHFAALKHVRGWAGLYAVSPDRSAVLGQVPGIENLYELGAATGRGVMQSYGLSLAMAELIRDGGFSSFDASPLSRRRFENGAFLPENLDI